MHDRHTRCRDQAELPPPEEPMGKLRAPERDPAQDTGQHTHPWHLHPTWAASHARYLGGPAGDADDVLGVQPGQRRGLRLGLVQGVEVLALVVVAPAVHLTVLGQSQAVGGACSHVDHLLPWRGEGRGQLLSRLRPMAMQTFTRTLGQEGSRALPRGQHTALTL